MSDAVKPAGKTPQQAFDLLKESLKKKILEFKESLNKNEYSADDAVFLVKETIKDRILDFQNELVKIRQIENGEKLEKKTPPNISEKEIHKLKDEYGHDEEGKSKAYATAWKISKLKKRKHKKTEEDSDISEPLMKEPTQKAENSKQTPKVREPTQKELSDYESHLTHDDPHLNPKCDHCTRQLYQTNIPKTQKAEPGQMSPELLAIHKEQPKVPTHSADKHPFPIKSLPIKRKGKTPPTLTKQSVKKGELQKDLYGLPNNPETPQQMAHKLSKNVFKVMKRDAGSPPVGDAPVPKTGKSPVLKAEDKPYKDLPKKPVKDPNALTDLKGKDFKDVDRKQYERELLELRHTQSALPSDKLPADANQKDTGSGGQIKKGKVVKGEELDKKDPSYRFQHPTQAESAKRKQIFDSARSVTAAGLTSNPSSREAHIKDAFLPAGGGKPTKIDSPATKGSLVKKSPVLGGKDHQSKMMTQHALNDAYKLSGRTMDDKNHKMPAQQVSTKIGLSPEEQMGRQQTYREHMGPGKWDTIKSELDKMDEYYNK